MFFRFYVLYTMMLFILKNTCLICGILHLNKIFFCKIAKKVLTFSGGGWYNRNRKILFERRTLWEKGKQLPDLYAAL